MWSNVFVVERDMLILDDILELHFLLLNVWLDLIDDHLCLHERKKPLAIVFRRHGWDHVTVRNDWFVKVLALLLDVEVLKVVDDSDMIQEFAIFAHETVSRFPTSEQLIVSFFICLFKVLVNGWGIERHFLRMSGSCVPSGIKVNRKVPELSSL